MLPRRLDALLRDIIARHAFDTADPPLFAAIDRPLFPVGKRGLRKHAGLHRHLILDDDYLATNRVWQCADRLRADGSDGVAHHGHDGDLHGLSLRLSDQSLSRMIDGCAISRCEAVHERKSLAPSSIASMLV